MKKFVFIGNRPNLLKVLQQRNALYQPVMLWVLEDSLLHLEMENSKLPFQLFKNDEASKKKMMSQLRTAEFDLLFSNGCPFVLPVAALNSNNDRLFINTHPSYLPELRGKTPLNGVFYLGYNHVGATTHYMDDGIDTGRIIYQQKQSLTPDIDQGLVYYMSFLLEATVFEAALDLLEKHQFRFEGDPQKGEGSFFNRSSKIFSIDFSKDSDEDILKKVRSVGIPSQGIKIVFEKEVFTVFEAEKIVNPFLLDLFKECEHGALLLKYSNKLLIKTKEGIIKFTHVG